VTLLVRSGVVNTQGYLQGFRWLGSFGAVTVDGESGRGEDVESGDVVSLWGTETTSPISLTDTADETDLSHLADGPVSLIDLPRGRLEVMGQHMSVAGFSCTGQPGANDLKQTLEMLRVGDRVTVSGYGSRDGSLLATRVNRRGAGGPYLIRGFVHGLDVTVHRFSVNGLVIDFHVAQLQDFPSGSPEEGDQLVAFADLAPVNGVLEATRLKFISGHLAGTAGANTAVEGMITRFASLEDFDIDGHPISLHKAPVSECVASVPQPLRLNTWVGLYDGSLSETGVVTDQSSDVCLYSVAPAEITLSGTIESIDSSSESLTLLGFTVQARVGTLFVPGGAPSDALPTFADLRVGELITVSGLPGVVPGSLIASAITTPAALTSGRGQIRTLAYSLARPAILVAGVTIQTDEHTTYEVFNYGNYVNDAAWFFSLDWQNKCVKTNPYAGSVRAVLDRDEHGSWVATLVHADSWPCPDDGWNMAGTQKALCAAR
jgi:hypothetical protein